MIPRQERVRDRLRLFWAVYLDTENYEDAMWAVLERDGQESRRSHDLDPVARAILAGVCAAMGIRKAALVRAGRAKPLANARWVAMRVLRDAGYSLHAIGRHLHRTHATVAVGLGRIGERRDLMEIAERVRTSPQVQARRAA